MCVFGYQVKAVPNEGKKTYNVTYVPKVVGNHKVTLSQSAQGAVRRDRVVVFVYWGTALLVFARSW